MSYIPELTWTKILRGSVLVAASYAAEVLDAIWAKIDSAGNPNDYAGNPRPNPVVATRYQNVGTTEAIYWSHNVGALNHKSIIAGQHVIGKTPTMRSPDATPLTANDLIVQTVVDAGAFNAWENANPFTSGRNFNYWKFASVNTLTTWQFDLYECKEAVALVINKSVPTGSPMAFLAGAIFDPHSKSAADAETDWRAYGIMSGYSGISTTFLAASEVWSGDNQNCFGEHHTSANCNHAGILVPGQTSVRNVDRSWTHGGSDGNSRKSMGGQNIASYGLPWHVMNDPRFVGTLRGIGIAPMVPLGAVFQSGGVDKAYCIFTNSWTNAYDCLVGKAA